MEISIDQLHDLLLVVFNGFAEVLVFETFQVADQSVDDHGGENAFGFIDSALLFQGVG